MNKLCAVALSVFFPAIVAAQAVPGPDDIVVTATRYRSPLKDLPARVTVVTAEDLKRLAFAKLDEVLAYVAGVTQSRPGGATTVSPVVSLRGVSAAQQGRTLVLLDGVPVNTSATGSSTVPFSPMSRTFSPAWSPWGTSRPTTRLRSWV